MVLRADSNYESKSNSTSSYSLGDAKTAQQIAADKLTAYFKKCSYNSNKTDQKIYSQSQPSIDKVSSKRALEIAKQWLSDSWNDKVKQMQAELKKEGKKATKEAAAQELRIRGEMKEKGISRESATANVEKRQEQEKKKTEGKSNAKKYAHDKDFDPVTSLGFGYRTAVRCMFIVGTPQYQINGKLYTREQIEQACKEIETEYNIDRVKFHTESRCKHVGENGMTCGEDHDGAEI